MNLFCCKNIFEINACFFDSTHSMIFFFLRKIDSFERVPELEEETEIILLLFDFPGGCKVQG